VRPAQRPIGVKVYTALLLVSSAVMALLGWAANAYYVPALCLLLQAMLLWRGRGFAGFKWIMLINQLSGLALILVLLVDSAHGACFTLTLPASASSPSPAPAPDSAAAA